MDSLSSTTHLFIEPRTLYNKIVPCFNKIQNYRDEKIQTWYLKYRNSKAVRYGFLNIKVRMEIETLEDFKSRCGSLIESNLKRATGYRDFLLDLSLRMKTAIDNGQNFAISCVDYVDTWNLVKYLNRS